MKDAIGFAMLAAASIAGLVAVCISGSRPQPVVTWLGAPVVGVSAEGGRYVSQPSITSHEIGLRSDGVVVWRRAGEATP